MKISLAWLSEWIDLKEFCSKEDPKGAKNIAACLTSRGIEVEAIHDQAAGFENVVTVQILKKLKHPQADRLSLCTVTLGQGEPLEIVCGAQNMKEGDRVALAQVGALLPNGVKITQSKIRGVVSNGMLCSESELGLSKESEGILILGEKTPLGKPLAQILGLDDVVLELSLTPNRGDCLSYLGIARELAAAKGLKVTHPKTSKLTGLKPASIKTDLQAGEDAQQFFGVEIEGVRVGPSPEAWVKKLKAMGSRSINNIVDATNLVLFEMGHPVHAYDRDRLRGKKLAARFAKKGEKLGLLDDSSVTLEGFEIVIADQGAAEDVPVGLAGVMGGGSTSVSNLTQKIFLECAEFSPAVVRKAARHHQKITDASYRFERGIDPLDTHEVLGRLAQLIVETAGGKIIGISEARSKSRASEKSVIREITVPPGYYEKFLGCEISAAESKKILKSLGCDVQENKVLAPSWRHDLRIKEDLAEEIARSIGYDRIPATLPRIGSDPESTKESSYEQVLQAKRRLEKLGLFESVRYSFTSVGELQSLGFEKFIRIQNPLSEAQEVLVPSLLPGLIQAAQENLHHHFGSDSLSLRWFELRPTFHFENPDQPKVESVDQKATGVREEWKLALLLSGPRLASTMRSEEAAVDFYDLKGVVEMFFESLGLRGFRFTDRVDSKLFHPGKSAGVDIAGKTAGAFGLLHPQIQASRKIKAPLWIAEISWDSIVKNATLLREPKKFSSWPQFPGIERDFALVVKDSVSAGAIESIAVREGRPLAKVVKIFDTYRGSQVAEGMTSVAVRVIFLDEARSLQEAEVEEISAKILARWKSELGAELRS